MPDASRRNDGHRGGDSLLVAAELLVRHGSPGAGAQLVREHSADGSGHCRGCAHTSTGAPVFPCRLRLVGEAAERLGRSR